MTFDAAIIGGGIIGASLALELAGRGLRVTLLDRQQPGMEASWAAAGMLSAAPETPQGIALVPLARASLALYPQFVAAIEQQSGRPAGFRAADTLHLFFAAEAQRELSTMMALNHGLGLAAEAIAVEEALESEPALNPAARAAARLPGEARVDNRALTAAALEAARRAGADIRSHTEVTALGVCAGRCTGVVTPEGAIAAANVVVAAGCWSGRIPEAARYAPTHPVRGQMAALRAEGLHLRHVVRSERGYLVPRDDGRILAGSTLENAGYAKRVTPEGIRRILDAAVEMVPALADAEVVETWSGLRPGSPDHLPILGPTDVAGLWMATGHYRNGILLAPVTARVMADWMATGRPSATSGVDWETFSPLRFGAARSTG